MTSAYDRPSTRLSPETRGMAWGLIGVITFGLTLPLTRFAVAELSPQFIGMGRAALAGLVAAVILLVGKQMRPTLRECGSLLVTAACIGVGFPIFVGLAMEHAPASHGGVVFGILPLATAIISALLHGDRPSFGFWLCGCIGSALVVIFTLREGGGHFTLGDLYLLGCIVTAALGYAVSGQLAKDLGGWQTICWTLVFALPVTLPAAAYLWPENGASVSPSVWACFAYLALFSQLIGFFWRNKGLALGGVARVSQIQLLQPFVTLAVAAVMLGDRPGFTALFFAIAVAVVVGFCRTQPIRRAIEVPKD